MRPESGSFAVAVAILAVSLGAEPAPRTAFSLGELASCVFRIEAEWLRGLSEPAGKVTGRGFVAVLPYTSRLYDSLYALTNRRGEFWFRFVGDSTPEVRPLATVNADEKLLLGRQHFSCSAAGSVFTVWTKDRDSLRLRGLSSDMFGTHAHLLAFVSSHPLNPDMGTLVHIRERGGTDGGTAVAVRVFRVQMRADGLWSSEMLRVETWCEGGDSIWTDLSGRIKARDTYQPCLELVCRDVAGRECVAQRTVRTNVVQLLVPHTSITRLVIPRPSLASDSP